MLPTLRSLPTTARIALLALAAASLGPTAHGVMSISFRQGQFQTGSGGEFVAITSPSQTSYYDDSALQTIDGQTGFSTFCLERGEHLYFNTPYTGDINDRALNGGTDLSEIPNLAGDPLSLGSAWLYLLFSEGSLPGYDYGTAPYSSTEKSNRKADAGVLQHAFWMLEDELTADLNNYYVDLAVDHFGSLGAAQAANNGQYGVGIINVWEGGTHRQDVLVRVAEVPDGASMIGLLGLGLAGVALSRRFMGTTA